MQQHFNDTASVLTTLSPRLQESFRKNLRELDVSTNF